jgi:hypothetical protein
MIMKQKIYSMMILMATVLMPLLTSCKQDEATINENIVGNWTADYNQCSYDGGMLMKYYQVNTDSIGKTILPAFEGCTISYTTDKTGTLNLPYLGLSLTDTYSVSTGSVTLTLPKLSNRSIKLDVTSITSSQMTVRMSVSDVSALISAVDTTANSNNADLMGLVKSAVPAISNVESKLASVDLTALGLNPMPSVTLVFNKK